MAHAGVMARMGYEEAARRIQRLFLQGRRQDAVLVVPDAFADGIPLVGPRERIVERLELWRAGPVTDLLVTAPDRETLRSLTLSKAPMPPSPASPLRSLVLSAAALSLLYANTPASPASTTVRSARRIATRRMPYGFHSA